MRFLADIGSNHNGDLDRAKALILEAAVLGCWGVKFQLFSADRLTVNPSSEQHKRELPVEWLHDLKDTAEKEGLAFVVTPFDMEVAKLLHPIVDAYKISSFDLLRHDLIAECCSHGKELILATGMADSREVCEAAKVTGFTATLLHCVSDYPAQASDSNLSAIDTLRAFTRSRRVGWSDHTHDERVIRRAVLKHDADLIEFHLDMDGKGWEYRYGHCWLPEEMGEVISEVTADYLDGTGAKVPTYSEDPNLRADPADGLRPMRCAR